MTNMISVEYEVLVGVKIDMDSGKVIKVVAHTEEFNSAEPTQVYAGSYEGEDLPEYLPPGHPIREKAESIAGRLLARGEVLVPFADESLKHRYKPILDALMNAGFVRAELEFNDGGLVNLTLRGFGEEDIEYELDVVKPNDPNSEPPTIIVPHDAFFEVIRQETGVAIGESMSIVALLKKPIDDVYGGPRNDFEFRGQVVFDVIEGTVVMNRAEAIFTDYFALDLMECPDAQMGPIDVTVTLNPPPK